MVKAEEIKPAKMSDHNIDTDIRVSIIEPQANPWDNLL